MAYAGTSLPTTHVGGRFLTTVQELHHREVSADELAGPAARVGLLETLLGEPPFDLDCRHASRSGSGDGLPVYAVLNVSASPHALDGCAS